MVQADINKTIEEAISRIKQRNTARKVSGISVTEIHRDIRHLEGHTVSFTSIINVREALTLVEWRNARLTKKTSTKNIKGA